MDTDIKPRTAELSDRAEVECKHDRDGALEYVGFNDLRCADCGALGVTVCIWDNSIHTGPCGWCDDEPA
jgi:hypothetical protein